MAVSTKLASILIVVFLLIGIVAGYFAGSTAAPPAKTVTVPAGATTVTVTTSITTTRTVATPTTVTVPAVGLQGDILIGALLPLTGVLSSYGENDKVALELAVSDVNEWLTSLGKPWRVKLIVEDTATDPKTALDKVQALHGRGVKIFIGPMSSAEVSEIKSYADANGLLIISQSSTSPALSIPNDSILRFCPMDVAQGAAIARIMWDRGIRYLVPVWRGDTWGDGLKEFSVKAFDKILKASGQAGGIDSGIRYDPAAKEFSAEAAKLASIVDGAVKSYGKDKVGVLVISFEEVAAIFAASKAYPILSEVKWQGSDGTAGTAVLIEDKSLAEFSVKVSFYNTIGSPGASPYTDRVKSYVYGKLKREPEAYAYFAYDALWAIALALDSVGKYDGVAVRNAIPQILKHYMGASGFFSLDENGDRATGDYDILAIKLVAGEYKWETIGAYRYATDSVEWK